MESIVRCPATFGCMLCIQLMHSIVPGCSFFFVSAEGPFVICGFFMRKILRHERVEGVDQEMRSSRVPLV